MINYDTESTIFLKPYTSFESTMNLIPQTTDGGEYLNIIRFTTNSLPV